MEHCIRAIAGTFILVSLLLAYYHSRYWLWFTAFVGANLLQSGFTRWCLMEKILAKLGVAKTPEAEGGKSARTEPPLASVHRDRR